MGAHIFLLMKSLLIFSTCLFINFSSFSQSSSLASGPMMGHLDHESAIIWLEAADFINKAELIYWEKSKSKKEKKLVVQLPFELDPKVVKFELADLTPETEYEYKIELNDKEAALPISPATFKTPIKPGKKQVNDFKFMVGSCMNNPNDILNIMTKTPADFMIWLGDNHYFSSSDYESDAGMKKRHQITKRQLKDLLAVRPNFAIWDDHDYGPNNSGGNFKLKSSSLKYFQLFWGNKSYGEPHNPGVYSSFNRGDAAFFLTDDRYYRSSEIKQDVVHGRPNELRKFFGDQQMKWLQNQLKASAATFKFIVCGSQVLNEIGSKESLRQYTFEFNQLMDFITKNKIEGVIFLSGDRHFSEMTFYQPQDCYKLFDFTCSALTSAVHPIKSEKEKNNPQRIPGSLLMENNFGIIAISGPAGNRTVQLKTLDINGTEKWNFAINENDLKFK